MEHNHPTARLNWQRDCPACVAADPDGSITTANVVDFADIEIIDSSGDEAS